MARPQKNRKHLYVCRDEMVYKCFLDGYNGEEIGIMFGISRSVVNRIIKAAQSKGSSAGVRSASGGKK